MEMSLGRKMGTKKRRKNKVAFRSRGKGQNRSGMFLMAAIVGILMVAIAVNSHTLKQKQNEYLQQEAALDLQIQEEQNRTMELEEFRKYTQTQAYIEEVAKEKLGLVHEGEIVFKMK